MKKLFFALVLPCMSYALEIPKSSLEVVKHDVATKLAAAQKERNTSLISKFQTALDNIEKKIKKFELEWLKYRKSQLMIKPTDTAVTAEINEIDKLIKERS